MPAFAANPPEYIHVVADVGSVLHCQHNGMVQQGLMYVACARS